MSNEIVRDIVETHQAVTTTPEYQSPNGLGAILEGFTQGFTKAISSAEKSKEERLPLEPGMKLVQDFMDRVSSTSMSPSQRQLEADNTVRALDKYGYNASEQSSIWKLTGGDDILATVKGAQNTQVKNVISQDQFISDIADSYGIQGTAEERWAAGNELLATKTAAYIAKKGLKEMTSAEDQEKFINSNPQLLRADIQSDMRAYIIQDGGVFTSQLLEKFKRDKTAELADSMDLALASKLVDYALIDYEGLAKKQREGITNTQQELEEIQKLESSREWANYLNSSHKLTINDETVSMTGQQIEAAKKAFGPEAWNVIISQQMIELAPFMSGLGTVQDLPQTSYKYFINGSVGKVLEGVSDGDALNNIEQGTGAALRDVKANLDKLPRSVRNVDKLSYSEAVAWLQGYNPWTKEQVDKAFEGREAEKPIRASVGAKGLASGLNDRSNDSTFIQVDPSGNIRVYRNSVLNRLSSAFVDPNTGVDIGKGIKIGQKTIKPVLEEATGEGRFIALGSYDAIEAGQVSDMALSIISNMTKFGMSTEEARKTFNRIQIENSTAAQRYVNMLKDYEAGREPLYSSAARQMSSDDVKIIEDAINEAKPTVSSKAGKYAPQEGINWTDVAAETFGALPYGLTSYIMSQRSEANKAVLEEAAQRAVSTKTITGDERAKILKEEGIKDPEATVYENGIVEYTDSKGRRVITMPKVISVAPGEETQEQFLTVTE